MPDKSPGESPKTLMVVLHRPDQDVYVGLSLRGSQASIGKGLGVWVIDEVTGDDDQPITLTAEEEYNSYRVLRAHLRGE